jgi:hypothetical protein
MALGVWLHGNGTQRGGSGIPPPHLAPPSRIFHHGLHRSYQRLARLA